MVGPVVSTSKGPKLWTPRFVPWFLWSQKKAPGFSATNLGVFGCATNFTTRKPFWTLMSRWAFSGRHVPIREFFHDRRVRECSELLCNELTGFFQRTIGRVWLSSFDIKDVEDSFLQLRIYFSHSLFMPFLKYYDPKLQGGKWNNEITLIGQKHLSPKNNSTELQGDNEWFMIDFQNFHWKCVCFISIWFDFFMTSIRICLKEIRSPAVLLWDRTRSVASQGLGNAPREWNKSSTVSRWGLPADCYWKVQQFQHPNGPCLYCLSSFPPLKKTYAFSGRFLWNQKSGYGTLCSPVIGAWYL